MLRNELYAKNCILIGWVNTYKNEAKYKENTCLSTNFNTGKNKKFFGIPSSNDLLRKKERKEHKTKIQNNTELKKSYQVFV